MLEIYGSRDGLISEIYGPLLRATGPVLRLYISQTSPFPLTSLPTGNKLYIERTYDAQKTFHTSSESPMYFFNLRPVSRGMSRESQKNCYF